MEIIENIYNNYIVKNLLTFLDIFIVAYLIYVLYKIIAGTRSIQTLKGIIIIILAYLIGKLLKLNTFVWLFEKGLEVAAIALIILFQNELRRIVMKLGENTAIGGLFRKSDTEVDETLEIIFPIVYKFSEKQLGALIVFTKATGLRGVMESGIEIDASLSKELIETIFDTRTILHDGAVIISNERIAAAGCLLPLTERMDLEKIFGTRHRAAIGLSEETDAVIVVVSEENGNISIAYEGKLYYGLKPQKFENTLKDFLTQKNQKKSEVKEKRRHFLQKTKQKLFKNSKKTDMEDSKNKEADSSKKTDQDLEKKEQEKKEEKTHV